MTDPAVTAEELRRHRPELLDAYAAALPGARAAVLGRLWGALAREPIPGLGPRCRDGARLTVALPGDRAVTGDAGLAEPFAAPPAGFALRVAGRAYDDPAALLGALDLPAGAGPLGPELADSVANLALARAGAGPAAPTLADLVALPSADALVAVEQSVVDGHPLHPGCRTRLGMTAREVLAYAPEHRPTVALELVAVPPDRWLSTGTGLPPLLPVHPWQRDHVLAAHPALRPTGRRLPARPLMSLRTLVPAGDPSRHLKTALDVQLTSAVRIVSPAAVHNGPAVSALLARLAPPGLEVLAEPAGGAVLVDGRPCRSLAAVVRVAPRLTAGEVAVPLAALAAGRSPLAVQAAAMAYGGDPLALLDDLAAVLLPPVCALLHAGVALEAHGQNTLAVLRGGRPVRLVYRDLGGVRISPARLAAAGQPAPALRGDLATDDPDALRDKVAGALAVALGDLVAALSRHTGTEPARLWARATRAAAAAYAGLPPAAAGDARALLGPTLPVKATTAMRLATDPLADLWARLPNPMGDAR